MSIEVRHISKTFGSFHALRDVSLIVPGGQLVALLGPSGSGKTTLLRIIAGLEQSDPGSGPILFHAEDVATRHARHRQVGFVFQHYALFRHMSVFENIAFGLRVKPRHSRPAPAEIRRRVRDLLRLIQLEPQADRYPSELSGGQRQRVALARALAVEPQVLLLDEPFGALDAKVRRELRAWLRRLHDELHVTSVFVTHDQDEALEVADRVVVMNDGRIEQSGTPDEVFHQPRTEFVMRFLGEVNAFRGRVESGRVLLGDVNLPNIRTADDASGEAAVLARPHELDVDTAAAHAHAVPGTVLRVHSAGPDVRVEIVTERGEELVANLPHGRVEALGLAAGTRVYVSLKAARVFVGDKRASS